LSDAEENKLLRKALFDIAYLSRSLEDSKRIAQTAVNDTCPFLALLVKDAVSGVEEARKAS
jgi:hypothetical protein